MLAPSNRSRRLSLTGEPVAAALCVVSSGPPGQPPRIQQTFTEIGDAFAFGVAQRFAGEATSVAGFGKAYRYVEKPKPRPRGSRESLSNWELAQ